MKPETTATKVASQPILLERLFASRQPRGYIGVHALTIIIVLGGIESVPGWQRFGLNLNPIILTVLAAAAGVFAGATGARIRLAGAISGGICGAGAMGAYFVLLASVNFINALIATIAILFGFILGLGVYWVAERLARPISSNESFQPGDEQTG